MKSLRDHFKELKEVNVALKLVFVPIAKNKLLFRLENNQDQFDADAQTYPIDMGHLIDLMWQGSNPFSEVPEYTLTETSVTGNMPVEEMQSRRIIWKTVDDDREDLVKSKIEYGIKDEVVSLEPQRIRVFIVEYKPAAEDFLQ